MAFVNENIKIEDVNTYNLFEIKCKYLIEVRNKSPQKVFDKKVWTIDRDREIWLHSITSLSDPEEDFFIPWGYEVYVLYMQGKYYEVILTSVPEESSTKNSEDPFIKIRKLISIRLVPRGNDIPYKKLVKIVNEALKTQPARDFPDKNIIELLEEALSIYGLDGQKGPHGLGDTFIDVKNIIAKLKV